MKHIQVIIFFLLAVVIWGCKEEDFKAYKEIDEFSIISPQDTSISLVQLEDLVIRPTLKGLNPDKQYTYQWRLYMGDAYDVIATTKDLNIPIELVPEDYTIQLIVTESSSGIKAISQLFNLKVTGAFPEGWLVGNNVNGKGQLSFIRISDQEIFYNPLEEINGKVYPEKLVSSLSGVMTSFFYGSFKQLFYFTPNGLRVFDPETMLEISALNDYFYKPMSFNEKPAYGVNGLNADQYLVSDGNLYAANGTNFGLNDAFGTFSDRFEGDYVMFPFVFPNSSQITYFYDNKNKRFMSGSFQGRELSVPSSGTTNGQYNLNNIKRTMLGADATLNNNYLALMGDGNAYYIYAFRLRTAAAIATGYYTQLSSPIEVNNLTGFAAASDIERAYYSSNQKIFKVSAANGTVTEIYSLSEGGQIVDLKMLKTGTDENRQLTIAVNKGGEGEVHCIYIDDFGDLDKNRVPKVYSGFGTITNLSYRNPS